MEIKILLSLIFALLIYGCNSSNNDNQNIDIKNNTMITELRDTKNSYTTLVTKNNLVLMGGDEGFNIINSNQNNRNNSFKIPTFKSKENLNRSNNAKDVKIYSLVEQKDGKIIIGGNFGYINEYKTDSLVRLNSDGSIDSTFEAMNTFNGEIYTIAILDDDSILIGGYFKNIKNQEYSGLVKLTKEGKIDTLFHNSLIEFDMSVVNDIKIIDNSIYLGGSFVKLTNTEVPNEIPLVSLDKFGNLNNEFNSKISILQGQVFEIAYKNNNIIAVGDFIDNNNTINNIVKFDTKGNMDYSFKLANIKGLLFDIEFIDNKMLIGGDFVTDNNTSIIKGFAMYDNTKLISFNSIDINADIYDISLYNDNVILAGKGNYTINGNTYNNSIMLNLNHFEEQ